MRSERSAPARKYWVALFFLLLGLVLGIWHNRQISRGRQDVVVGLVRLITAPFASGFRHVGAWFYDETAWIRNGRSASAENGRLHIKVDQLQYENIRLREAQANYLRLRDDLGFVRSSTKRPIAADVIARKVDPGFDTIVISRGSRDGIHVNSVVRNRVGLVGHVFEVTPTTSTVLILTDQKSGVGARIQRPESRATGVCEGQNTSVIALKYLPFEANVQRGDVVVTSGLGGVYPPGLLIGTVDNVKADEGNVGKSATVIPVVDFDRLEEVYILP